MPIARQSSRLVENIDKKKNAILRSCRCSAFIRAASGAHRLSAPSPENVLTSNKPASCNCVPQKLAVLINERGTGRGFHPCSDDKRFATRTSRNCGKYSMLAKGLTTTEPPLCSHVRTSRAPLGASKVAFLSAFCGTHFLPTRYPDELEQHTLLSPRLASPEAS
jgi:hypothetical protein